MRKIFADFPVCGPFELSPDDARHVCVVLRHTVGDVVQVADSSGDVYECIISEIKGRRVLVEPKRKISGSHADTEQVILAAGLLKNDKFDWVVQKATELGASVIVPVQMEHCVVKLNNTRAQNRLERWQKIAAEAAKQCGRNDIPRVTPVQTLESLMTQYRDMRFVVPYEKEVSPLRDICRDVQTGNVVLVIGPEGGFAQTEIDYIQQHAGWCRTVSLGARILRAETASVAMLAIVMYERGFR